ncbi:sensor histidine kinase [Luteimonas viscosa]|uniref:histidine kinase n=1 Tax=Luteimonas viscosa TaxID=1132694 RepID=A0A5D4XMG8_9GAMM|nr:histidine kinase [Luteimonas viscosa]TYT25324.1 sensor histidine kinase [Luteimonas viscosa]
MAGAEYGLRDPLPSDVLIGGNAVWSRYRQYPVFSLPWLAGRTVVFAVVIAGLAGMSFLGVGVATGSYGAGAIAGGYQFVAFVLMTSTGPALATIVRHRRWPEARERIGVVVAWLAGVAIAFFVDRWASGEIRLLVAGALDSTDGFGAVRRTAEENVGRAGNIALAFNILVLFVIYGIGGGGLALRAYFSERRRWEGNLHRRQLQALAAQKRDADLRLGVLQAQVEPHFLFNTLASVRALVRRDPARAEATLDALVSHLRATIPKMRGEDIELHSTLGQQLDICASYLEVMRLRSGDRLSCRIDAEPSLRRLRYPPLLLITLVENAVKHGIEPKPGAGTIDIRASRDADTLVVAVSDDGVGLKAGTGPGMGLANVRAQLQTRYGTRAALRLSGSVGAGTRAEIRTPMEPMA